jgi:hypothetical protein
MSSLICWQATGANARKADSIYILLCAFKMFKMIKSPANCEIWSVVHFLNARNVKPADIHCQICDVYSEHAMIDGMVRKWYRKYTERRDNVHDELWSGWPSVIICGQVLRGGDTETGAPL